MQNNKYNYYYKIDLKKKLKKVIFVFFVLIFNYGEPYGWVGGALFSKTLSSKYGL